MARLFQCGFELQSTTAGVEFSSSGLNGGGISTSTARSGGASMQINVAASFSWIGHIFKASVSSSEAFIRVYVNFTTLPASGNPEIMSVYSAGGASQQACICVTSAGLLQLRQGTSAGSQIGSSSSALVTGTWYRVEMDVTAGTGSATLKGYLNGVNFASSTTATVSTFDACYLGNPGTSTTYNLFYDDWAINDSSGSFQNSLPGAGNITHLKPSGTGDANGFLTGVGGTAGVANNYTRVSEVTPDDATSYNGSALLNAEDLFEVTNPTMGANDTINVVAVGVRMADLVSADATAAFKVELEKKTGGTKTQSATLIPNSTTWLTNAAAVPRNYPLVTYQAPDGDNWTYAALESLQIGYIQSAINVQTIAVSAVWASVDYTPEAGQSLNRISNYGKYVTVGDGISRSEVAN